MYLLKKMLGFGNDLKSEMSQINIPCTLYQVEKNERNHMITKSMLTISGDQNSYYLTFEKVDGEDQYRFPVHLEMTPVSFSIIKSKEPKACFQWQLQEPTDHVGCYFDPIHKVPFKEVLCKILKVLANDENIKYHLDFCKQLNGIPSYKQLNKDEETITESKLASRISHDKESLNQVLVTESQKSQNKMVHTCSYYIIERNTRKLLQPFCVFVLKCLPNFEFEYQLINQTGYTFMSKTIPKDFSYDIDCKEGIVRWLEEQNAQLYEINFDGRPDAAQSLKYNMFECIFERNRKAKISEELPADQLSYLKHLDDSPSMHLGKEIVKKYDNDKPIKDFSQQVHAYESYYKEDNKDKHFCQAKINNFSITALGSMLQKLTISQENEIKMTEYGQMYNKKSQEINVQELLLHDLDSKCFVMSNQGSLHYWDMEKKKALHDYPFENAVSICPQFKLAETDNFKTFKVISNKGIFTIDPRSAHGVESSKNYTNDMQFTSMAVDGKGRFAIGSETGEIRLYKQIGKNANSKFTSTGEPVIHLESTKDGFWLLATFPTFLRLIPTETAENQSLYETKLPYKDRPQPMKLQISLQDKLKLGIMSPKYLPAKFDETLSSHQSYIVSGFSIYTVIWNLSDLAQGKLNNYVITQTKQEVLQNDFKYNNPNKLITTTKRGIVIKESKMRN